MNAQLAGVLFTSVGQVIALLGAIVAALAVIVSDKKAEDLSGTHWGGNQSLKAAIISQSRAASRGLYCVAGGTLLQLLGTVAPLFG